MSADVYSEPTIGINMYPKMTSHVLKSINCLFSEFSEFFGIFRKRLNNIPQEI